MKYPTRSRSVEQRIILPKMNVQCKSWREKNLNLGEKKNLKLSVMHGIVKNLKFAFDMVGREVLHWREVNICLVPTNRYLQFLNVCHLKEKSCSRWSKVNLEMAKVSIVAIDSIFEVDIYSKGRLDLTEEFIS